jgi:hypothetical protein
VNRLVSIFLFLSVTPMFGATYLYSTSAGQLENSHPVDVTASIDFANSTTILITITNLAVNPTSDDQDLNALTFSINGNVGVTSFASSGRTVTINGKNPGDYSLGSAASVPWTTTATNGATTAIGLCDFNAPGCGGQGGTWPKGTLVGAPDATNAYSAAKGSLKGKHDPLMFETVTFTVTGTNIPYQTLSLNEVSSVIFNFGATSGETATGTLVSVTPNVPEPGAGWLALLGLAFVLLPARFRRLRAVA